MMMWKSVAIVSISMLFLLSESARSALPPLEKLELESGWCGAKALWLVCKAYGIPETLPHIKDMCGPGTTADGVCTVLDLEKCATKLGLFPLSIRTEIDWLKCNRILAVTMHRNNPVDSGSELPLHCLLVLGFRDGRFVIVDPALTQTVFSLTEEEFAKSWTGEVLLVARNSDDLPSRAAPWIQATAIFLPIHAGIIFLWLAGRHLRKK